MYGQQTADSKPQAIKRRTTNDNEVRSPLAQVAGSWPRARARQMPAPALLGLACILSFFGHARNAGLRVSVVGLHTVRFSGQRGRRGEPASGDQDLQVAGPFAELRGGTVYGDPRPPGGGSHARSCLNERGDVRGFACGRASPSEPWASGTAPPKRIARASSRSGCGAEHSTRSKPFTATAAAPCCPKPFTATMIDDIEGSCEASAAAAKTERRCRPR